MVAWEGCCWFSDYVRMHGASGGQRVRTWWPQTYSCTSWLLSYPMLAAANDRPCDSQFPRMGRVQINSPAPHQVENMLALGPFPRFAGSTVKNIEESWKKVVDNFGIEEMGGKGREGATRGPAFCACRGDRTARFVHSFLLLHCFAPRVVFAGRQEGGLQRLLGSRRSFCRSRSSFRSSLPFFFFFSFPSFLGGRWGQGLSVAASSIYPPPPSGLLVWASVFQLRVET